jgi:hypothetical protein
MLRSTCLAAIGVGYLEYLRRTEFPHASGPGSGAQWSARRDHPTRSHEASGCLTHHKLNNSHSIQVMNLTTPTRPDKL